MSRVIVFDVEHGFCAFAKSDTGSTLMIDCGKGKGFSPVEYVVSNELNDAVAYNGYRLTRLVITHPHDDHIEDIRSVIGKLPPYQLTRQGYDWEDVKQSEADYDNLDVYSSWQQRYNAYVPEPNWGTMLIQPFWSTTDEARELGEANCVNNSGIVTVVTFTGTQHTEKFLFGADVEEAGWEALLLHKLGFADAVAGTDFFIVPHHGHSSGFSQALYDAMGKPILNIISVTTGDEFVDPRYMSQDYATGAQVDGQKRYSLSTRNDGTICVDVTSEGKFRVQTAHLAPNIVAKAASFRL